MSFSDLPPSAAWRHQDARSGFEVAFTQRSDNGCLLTGCTTAVEDGQAWIVEYRIRVDGAWRTRSARLRGSASGGRYAVALETDGAGHWRVDGLPAPNLDGCLDVDLGVIRADKRPPGAPAPARGRRKKISAGCLRAGARTARRAPGAGLHEN